MNRVFVDMDGPLVDFDGYAQKLGKPGDEIKKMRGAYFAMKPTPGALGAIGSIIGMGFEVWVATKPPTGIYWAYGDKARWVLEHVPALKRRIIITHDKGLLGDAGDYLIDDRPHKANCGEFAGELLVYTVEYGWPQILRFLQGRRPVRNGGMNG